MNLCKRMANLIGPYLYGQTTQQEADALEEHIKSCRDCASEVSQRRRIMAALSPETPTPAERERMIRAVRSRITADSVRSRSAASRFLRVSAAVAAAIALFSAGLWTGERDCMKSRTTGCAHMVRLHVGPMAHRVTTASIPSNEPRSLRSVSHPAMKRSPLVAGVRSRRLRHRSAAVRFRAKPIVHHGIPQRLPTPREERIEVAMYPAPQVAPVPLGVDDARVVLAEER
jgi:hypothetical protein